MKVVKHYWFNETCASSDDSSLSMDIDDEIKADENYINFRDMIQIYDIANIFEFCNDQCNRRYLSVLIYSTLHRLNISYQETLTFLKHIAGKGNGTVVLLGDRHFLLFSYILLYDNVLVKSVNDEDINVENIHC